MEGLPPPCQTLVYDNGKQIVLCIKQTELSIIQTWHLVFFLNIILFVCFDIHNFKNENETIPLCKHSKHHFI